MAENLEKKIKEKEAEISEMKILFKQSNDATDKSLLLQYNNQLTELLKQQSFLMGKFCCFLLFEYSMLVANFLKSFFRIHFYIFFNSHL